MKLRFLCTAILATTLVGCGSNGNDSTTGGTTFSSKNLTLTESFEFDGSAGNVQRDSAIIDGNKIYESVKNVVGNISGDMNLEEWYSLSHDALVHYPKPVADSNGRYLIGILASDISDTGFSFYQASDNNSTDLKATFTEVVKDISGKSIASVFSPDNDNVNASKLAKVTGVFPAGSSCAYDKTIAVNKPYFSIEPSGSGTTFTSFANWQTSYKVSNITSDTWAGIQWQKGTSTTFAGTADNTASSVLWTDNKIHVAFYDDASVVDNGNNSVLCNHFNKVAADAAEAAFIAGYK